VSLSRQLTAARSHVAMRFDEGGEGNIHMGFRPRNFIASCCIVCRHKVVHILGEETNACNFLNTIERSELSVP
jgi:hypothetical protein